MRTWIVAIMLVLIVAAMLALLGMIIIGAVEFDAVYPLFAILGFACVMVLLIGRQPSTVARDEASGRPD